MIGNREREGVNMIYVILLKLLFDKHNEVLSFSRKLQCVYFLYVYGLCCDYDANTGEVLEFSFVFEGQVTWPWRMVQKTSD